MDGGTDEERGPVAPAMHATLTDIARRLQVPVATVNSRLTRALAKLRERLAVKVEQEVRALPEQVDLQVPGYEIFWNPAVLQHYLDGIQFAMGDLEAEAAPSAELSPQPKICPAPDAP